MAEKTNDALIFCLHEENLCVHNSGSLYIPFKSMEFCLS